MAAMTRSSMRFRPCIDIHAGEVKQIVGSTLTDGQDAPITNFVATQSAGSFAKMYKRDGLTGGHVIMLGASEANQNAALEALREYPNGLQVGGGINADNCKFYIENGASHVIVTSYVFRDGQIDFDRLEKLKELIGKEHLVLDLSCRRKADDGKYYVMTDRWQKFTTTSIDEALFHKLADYCDEFLVHAVDVEGKRCGIQQELVELLSQWSPIPVTYAGGASSLEDLDFVDRIGRGKVDLSIGSALDIFGGDIEYDDVVAWGQAKRTYIPCSGSAPINKSAPEAKRIMECVVDKLQLERAQQLSQILDVEENDRSVVQQRIQALKETFEELELAAAAATAEPISPVLNAALYTEYLLVVLLSKNLNDARFLWKRIALQIKQESEVLCKVWEIGKALWQRNYSAAYVAMDESWPKQVEQLVSLLRKSTRGSTAELLSVSYSTISCGDAMQALGFSQPHDLLQYCAELQWNVSTEDQLVHPTPLAHARLSPTGIEQLETLSQYVLHLEQSTVLKLP